MQSAAEPVSQCVPGKQAAEAWGGGLAGSPAQPTMQAWATAARRARRHPGTHLMFGEGHWLPALHCVHVGEPNRFENVPGLLHKSQSWEGGSEATLAAAATAEAVALARRCFQPARPPALTRGCTSCCLPLNRSPAGTSCSWCCWHLRKCRPGTSAAARRGHQRWRGAQGEAAQRACAVRCVQPPVRPYPGEKQPEAASCLNLGPPPPHLARLGAQSVAELAWAADGAKVGRGVVAKRASRAARKAGEEGRGGEGRASSRGGGGGREARTQHGRWTRAPHTPARRPRPAHTHQGVNVVEPIAPTYEPAGAGRHSESPLGE